MEASRVQLLQRCEQSTALLRTVMFNDPATTERRILLAQELVMGDDEDMACIGSLASHALMMGMSDMAELLEAEGGDDR